MAEHTPIPLSETMRKQLNAAAPDLLEVLNLAVRYLEHPDVLDVTNRMALAGDVVVSRIRAAIAKAEGKEKL